MSAAQKTVGSAAAEEAKRAARVRRSAWLLATLAAAFYAAFIVWTALRAPIG